MAKYNRTKPATDLPEIAGIEFRKAVGYEGYAVGSDGSVWSSMKGSWKPRKLILMKIGYYMVSFDIGGVCTQEYVHRMVLFAFVGPPPSSRHHGCHNDGDPTNNKVDNLRWDTPKGNHADRVMHGTDVRGEKHPQTMLTNAEVARMRLEYAGGKSQAAIARDYSQHPGTIQSIVSRKNWKHVMNPTVWLFRCPTTGKLMIGTEEIEEGWSDVKIAAWMKKAAIIGHYGHKIQTIFPDIKAGQAIKYEMTASYSSPVTPCEGC